MVASSLDVRLLSQPQIQTQTNIVTMTDKEYNTAFWGEYIKDNILLKRIKMVTGDKNNDNQIASS